MPKPMAGVLRSVAAMLGERSIAPIMMCNVVAANSALPAFGVPPGVLATMRARSNALSIIVSIILGNRTRLTDPMRSKLWTMKLQ